ncbi:MAG: acylphosphatase [Victivallaceae bacterium]|nr:acylphosphatase [Victivallaceae bacterium]
MNIACRIIVKGRVTEVGFRWYTVDYVRQFPSLTGYVRNICHGQVEVLIQGPQNYVNQVRQWLKQGPSHARVDSYQETSEPVNESITSFEIM